MKGFVDFITDPAWCAVCLTAINTIAVVIIAVVQIRMQRQQTKLQEQQTNAQEYATYRQLYILIGNANREIDDFLTSMNCALWAPYYKNNSEYLHLKLSSVENMRKYLIESCVDYELKFSNTVFDNDGYLRVLTLMSRIINQTIESLDKGEVILTEGAETITYEQGKQDEAHMYALVQHYTNPYTQMVITQDCNTFRLLKNVVCCDKTFLNQIRERCKID